ncbi:MAG: TIM barrel protein [Candidatus Pacearchaeota archaeon]
MEIRFGPAGLGSVKEAISNLEEYNKAGIKACEIAFTYGVYIKKEEDAIEIGKAAKKFNIKLTIHAPYWINLNSNDKKKIEESKNRILECCKIGSYLGAKLVVFHPGFYGKDDKKTTYENIKKEIIKLQNIIEKNKYKIKLAPETTGKINVFGSLEEISLLVKETKCSFCLDFAHILARDKKIDYKRIEELFPQKEWHCHFSGIEYGEKGEKNHKITQENGIKELLKNLPKHKNITIINESPLPFEDSIKMIKVYKNLFN